MGARRWEDISDELEEALDDLYATHLIVTQVMGRYKKECPQMWEALARHAGNDTHSRGRRRFTRRAGCSTRAGP